MAIAGAIDSGIDPMNNVDLQEFQKMYLAARYPRQQIKRELTLSELAEVVLMLSQEVTLLQRKVKALEARQQIF